MSKGGWVTALLLFTAVLVFFFYGVFLPDQTLFSNDGPLGRLVSQCHRLPGRFFGTWSDLNNIGFDGGAAPPSISMILQWWLGPVWFSKLYALLSLLILGVGAWCFFRQSRLAPAACLLGGLAAMLNASFFSVACWGVAADDIAAGMFFLALAALADPASRHRWILAILAGFAVGMNVTEGADVGAIFSLLVALFAIYQAWIAEGPRLKNLAVGMGKLSLVVLCAVFLAAQAVQVLVSTSIAGVSGVKQNAKTNIWDWATQWSLPKTEMLGLLEPGLFGYRMEANDGSAYWGIVGRASPWEKYIKNGRQGPPPTGFYRYSGGGNYIGVLAALIAFWAVMQSFRPKNSVFNLNQKKWLWFWGTVAIVSLLLALGRYAPFYRWLYALPYFSTIRNPTKFLYLFAFGITILFAYGVDALCRKYLKEGMNARSLPIPWGRFEKNWIYGCGLVLVASLAAWYVYWQHQPQLEQYLLTAQINSNIVPAIANFSIVQAGWFPLFFFLGAGLLALILRGVFMGKQARTGVVLLGLLFLTDFGLANYRWVVFWNYKDKYASNPVVDRLRDKPYEHRAVLAPINWPPNTAFFPRLYKDEWLEQLLPYYNIQTFDIIEMSRIPLDFSTFVAKVNDTNRPGIFFHMMRAYQLTNTRFLFAPTGSDVFWDQRFPNSPLQLCIRFSLQPKPGTTEVSSMDEITAVPDSYGLYELFEIPSALPRAKLYSRWEVNTNDSEVLQQLFNPEFNPADSVFVAGGVPQAPETDATNPPDDAVQFVSYAPKDIVLKASAAAPSVLLFNSHFHPDWKVLVDGAREKLLRCNFLMRGVYLLPGTHTVEFKFQPPIGFFYFSVAADITALLVLGFFIYLVVKSRPPVPAPTAPASPATLVAPIKSNKSKSQNGQGNKTQRK